MRSVAPSHFRGSARLPAIARWLGRGLVFVDEEEEEEGGGLNEAVSVTSIRAVWTALRPYESEDRRERLEGPSSPKRAKKTSQAKILAWLDDHGESNASTIVRAFGGEDIVRVRLCELANRGLVLRTGPGMYAPIRST